MSVPRGTGLNPGDTGRAVRPILFRAPMRAANRAGAKNQTRRIVSASNSRLTYGTFEGLDLEAARAVRDPDGKLGMVPASLDAPCTYPRRQFRSGVQGKTQRRIVAVLPKVQAGDLFWEKVGRFGSRAGSTATYEVTAVDVRRVQDMTDDEAVSEGVAHVQVPTRFPLHARTPRGIFAWLWDQINGAGSWAANPWVWVYHYRHHAENVDALVARWTPPSLRPGSDATVEHHGNPGSGSGERTAAAASRSAGGV